MSIRLYKEYLHYFLIIFITITIDQVSKNFFIEKLRYKENMLIKINEFFQIVYAWNYGISFGMFSKYTSDSNIFFLILNIIIISYLFFIVRSFECKIQKYGVFTIIGGALGNIIDRIFRGAVFDFLAFNYKDYYFPAFNFADAFINIGVFIVIFSYIRLFKKN